MTREDAEKQLRFVSKVKFDATDKEIEKALADSTDQRLYKEVRGFEGKYDIVRILGGELKKEWTDPRAFSL